jgi:hypothetical protein
LVVTESFTSVLAYLVRACVYNIATVSHSDRSAVAVSPFLLERSVVFGFGSGCNTGGFFLFSAFFIFLTALSA